MTPGGYNARMEHGMDHNIHATVSRATHNYGNNAHRLYITSVIFFTSHKHNYVTVITIDTSIIVEMCCNVNHIMLYKIFCFVRHVKCKTYYYSC